MANMVKKVLIVDDFPLDAELTKRVLESCKDAPEVVIVSDGEEALHELGKTHDFDAILLDLALPKVDGFEVLKEISAKPYLSHVPVVVLSSTRNEADRIRTLMMGAKDFVEKALDYSAFKEDLTRKLARHGLCCTRLHDRA
ncbi:Response regulator receiver domain-containing protein [Massilia yuzhufengensis]|uniref:Response regulator receiver domain-containing protein n=2 Tax=Massilia yuzhufengensis TaxID=1164594 RepID=A0A1I1IDI5_9BURK|nr:Response regulator receiver domain-containing protein [Massilia yuzhufengensis]